MGFVGRKKFWKKKSKTWATLSQTSKVTLGLYTSDGQVLPVRYGLRENPNGRDRESKWVSECFCRKWTKSYGSKTVMNKMNQCGGEGKVRIIGGGWEIPNQDLSKGHKVFLSGIEKKATMETRQCGGAKRGEWKRPMVKNGENKKNQAVRCRD